mgnify:CR=1 FL=1
MLHAWGRLIMLNRCASVHGASSASIAHRRTERIRATQRARLSKQTIWSMNCARRRGNCDRLVDLHWTRVCLMGCLFALLSLVELSIQLLRFALDILFLLGGSLLEQVRLENLALSFLSRLLC